MAHCGSCKSNLGTGGKKGTGASLAIAEPIDYGFYGVQGRALRAGRATGTGMSPWTTTHAGIVLSNGKINKKAWIPATSSDVAPAGLEAWVYFPGGRKANLRISGTTQTRYVLAHKNGGPTGILVRLGDVARDLGTGGCGDLTGLPGTGGARVGRRKAGTGKVNTSINFGMGAPSRGQASNRWFKASYFDRPASNPASWVKITGAVPGPAQLWMHGAGPVHNHDVEVIQIKGSNSTLQALVAGWSLPHMINDIMYAPGTRGSNGSLTPSGPVYITMEGESASQSIQRYDVYGNLYTAKRGERSL